MRFFAAYAMLAAVSATVLPAQAADSVSPPHRRHHALVYDPVSRRVLVIGGQMLISNSQTPVLDDVWSWDGRRWTRVAGNTGTRMITHKLFADGASGVVAVMGRGLVARLDGARWSVVVPDSMTRRESAAGAWDPDRRRFVTFGGLVGGRAYDTSGETWEFDGRQWARVSGSGPPPSLGGAMAYDAARKVMVLFGGLDTMGKKRGETWEWNGSRWSRVATSGPSPRFGAGIAYDARRRETIVFGGVDSGNVKLNDTWRWDGHTWKRAETAIAPAGRSEGYLAYDAARGVVVMFGGEGAEVVPTLGDTWEWDGVVWRRVR